eukprot:NODE_5_length_72347_cov_1.339331.p43 type:complete len:216 gc:universal NODE_5_length_72347_cov_1.339331:51923-52570(+)
MNWEVMGVYVYNKGYCFSISRFHDVFTNIFQKPLVKSGKLSKQLNIEYNGFETHQIDGFTYYTYLGHSEIFQNYNPFEKMNNLFKSGEHVTKGQILKMYKLIYKEDLIDESIIDQVFKKQKKKYYTGTCELVINPPRQFEIIEKLNLLRRSIVPETKELDLEDDLYNIPLAGSKRKTSDFKDEGKRFKNLETYAFNSVNEQHTKSVMKILLKLRN